MRYTSAALILFGALLFSAAKLEGCTCLARSPRRALDQSDAVFHGRVLEVRHLRTLDHVDENGRTLKFVPETDDEMIVTFEVDAVWKARIARSVQVKAVRKPSQCDGFEFHAGTEYLVYVSAAQRTPHSDNVSDYQVDPCPPPIQVASLAESRKILGRERNAASNGPKKVRLLR